MSRICWFMVLVLGASTVAACSPDRGGTATGDDSATITVAAASSLTDAFVELGQQFEQTHSGTTVRFNFAASSTLARQIIEGAPASVFASADPTNMMRVDEAGLLEVAPTTFARNQLTLITRPGFEPPITSVQDLSQAGVVALCASTAPCGVLGDEVLNRAGVEVPSSRISRAPNARATLSAVSNGDADAALVYVTDALGAGDAVTPTPLPATLRVSTPYSVAALAGDPEPVSAEAFAGFLQSPQAQAILLRHGFMAP